jgi:hypothetical protein
MIWQFLLNPLQERAVMAKWKCFILACGIGLLLAGCAPTCTEQNKDKFVADVTQIGYSWDAIEFNVAYSPESKASQLQQLRGQADRLYTPLCADNIKTVLLQSLDERVQNIGNYANKPRPATEYFQAQFKTFQAASVVQLNAQINLATNTTARFWLVLTLIIVVVMLLLGFGAYFYFLHDRSQNK